MNNATIVTYNGVTMKGCLTKTFRQDAVYDDSNTDLIYYKFTVRVVGYCSQLSASTAPNGPFVQPIGGQDPTGTQTPANAVGTHIEIRSRLMEPRRDFVMYIGNTVVLASGPMEVSNPVAGTSGAYMTNKDVNSGPKPRVIDVTNIAGRNVWRIEFEIEICNVECDGYINVDENNASGVLNNRWSCTDEVDNNFMTTRTWQGRLRTTNATLRPNDFRAWVVPPLQKGFRRHRMQFVASADNLLLDYIVQDVEIQFAAPYPATSWQMAHAEHTGDGKQQLGELMIRFGCHRDTSRKALIQAALSIAETKLGLFVNVEAPRVIESLSITDLYGDTENGIELRARAVRTPKTEDSTMAAVRLGQLGTPLDDTAIGQSAHGHPFYDHRVSINPGIRGRVPIADAFAAYLQTPCSATHQHRARATAENQNQTSANTIAQGMLAETQAESDYDDEDDDANNNGEVITIDQYTVDAGDLETQDETYDTGDFDPGQQPIIEDVNANSIYTYFRCESTYEIGTNRIQLPIAKATNAPAPSLSVPGSILEDDTSVFIKLAPRVSRRRIRVEAERVGDWPIMPTPRDFEDSPPDPLPDDWKPIRYILLSDKDCVRAPDRSCDRQGVYRIGVEYLFGMSRAPEPTDKRRSGYIPWMNDGAAEAVGIKQETTEGDDGTFGKMLGEEISLA